MEETSPISYFWLVVWNIIFSHSVGNVIIPTDELIFFRGVGLNHQPDIYITTYPYVWRCPTKA
jgi:hypothetical protein